MEPNTPDQEERVQRKESQAALIAGALGTLAGSFCRLFMKKKSPKTFIFMWCMTVFIVAHAFVTLDPLSLIIYPEGRTLLVAALLCSSFGQAMWIFMECDDGDIY